MRTIMTNWFRFSPKRSEQNFSSFFITIWHLTGLLLVSTLGFAQTPITDPFAQCTNGCTANDIQIKKAYLVQPTSPYSELSSSFQCQGNANVKLALDLTTKTPRVGVYVFARIVNHADHTIVYATVGECFSTPLATGGTTKVVFNQAISWPCGTQIDLIDVFIGWGTGNTDFCAGSSDPRCPATPSKCFSLPPGEYISIQIPSATNASLEQCETTVGGGTSSFNLTSKNGEVSNNASGVSVNWWETNTSGVLSNFISTPTAYVSGSKNVYAKVKNNADTTAYSVATVGLTVDPRPTAAASAGTITCSTTTATLSGTGSSTGGNITYLWTGPGSITNSSSISASTSTSGTYTLKVTNSTTGCTATATASVSSNTTAPTFTVCLVQPTLCSNTAGSVTVNASQGTSFTYKLNGGTPQSSNVFSGLGGGSVTSITVTNQLGCSTTVNCANLVIDANCTAAAITQKETPINSSLVTTESASVKAFPNPFNDRVKFIVNSPTAGNGALEIYNIMGQKIKTVYQGRINAGNQSFELSIPKKQQETLIYVLKVDDKKVTGKLLQLNN